MRDNFLPFVVRSVFAILFFSAGLGKLTDPSSFAGLLASLHVPEARMLAYLVGIWELGRAATVIIGARIRMIGLLLAICGLAVGLIMRLQVLWNIANAPWFGEGFIPLAATAPRQLVADIVAFGKGDERAPRAGKPASRKFGSAMDQQGRSPVPAALDNRIVPLAERKG
ncbi:DoxX family protein [Mesorhizobium kowhaii]|uniref:DoxX family protein n=1 Tax=Mesorhizobium kowhaii TaxID=1300272 RepID=A0A2W7CQC6_9HYPH|nr:DoxX family protein [Mesorhizobium kowhaii]PZV38783.1 hypothetical protein B5V02_09000 [Mesorhizobium kowhaii]